MSNVLDSLLGRIEEIPLRAALEREIALLRNAKDFGLVFERHIPELIRLLTYPIKRGTKVQERNDDRSRTWLVKSVTGGDATLIDLDGLESNRSVEELVAILEFGDPIFPGLKSLGRIQRGEDKPFHTVINAENYHALEMLLYAYEGKIDVIYADPPYNTGARDWKYNNDYVDKNDTYAHSKWLSFMERRLLLAKKLLQPDGVLVVTIDENELNHLGVLLEDLFPDALRQMVTIVISPSGASGDGLSRVEEYAFFCFLGGTLPQRLEDDLLTAEKAGGRKIRWESLMRGGNKWYRALRENLCYPVLLDPKTHRIVDVGEPFDGTKTESSRPKKIKGLLAAWPVRGDGKLGIWRVKATTLKKLAEEGYAYTSSANEERGTWTIRYLMSGTLSAIESGGIEKRGLLDSGQADLHVSRALTTTPKTVWYRGRHTAGGSGGTYMVSALLGEKGKFTYPKSLYAVMDTLEIAVGDRSDAVVLDFFAGSGTTLHATAMLNARDGGHRQCIAVTNNEVAEDHRQTLIKAGILPGSAEFEQHGVFWAVTKPRCEAALTGVTAIGVPVEGEYDDGTLISDGLAENIEFFELVFHDRNDVARGVSFSTIAPLLWMHAGAARFRIEEAAGAFAAPESANYAVLFDVTAWRAFVDLIDSRPDVTHAFIVTDSLAQYQQISIELPASIEVSMLWDDYLQAFDQSNGGR